MSRAHPSAAVALVETTQEPDGYRYHLLRAATARFQRNIPALSEQELGEAEQQARRS